MSDVTLTCTVGGVSVALYNKVQVSERANQRTTASFGIVDTTNTQTTANGLTLANAGSTFTKTESSTSDFAAGTLASTLSAYNNNLQLNGTNAIKLQGTANALAGTNLYAYYKIFTFGSRTVSN